MSELPGVFTRTQIIAAFDALGLGDEMIAAVEIAATEVSVEMFVIDDDGDVIEMLGEPATVVITIPVDEDQ